MERVEPKSAVAVRVAAGQVVRVTDLEGRQVADFVAFTAADPREHLSQGMTRHYNWRAWVSTGDALYSNRDTVLARIVHDDVGGVHDLLFPPCNRKLYDEVYRVQDHDGCREHLAAALAPYGIEPGQITDPFNLFMNSGMGSDRSLFIALPVSKPGDRIEMRFEVDCIVGVSSCADDQSDCNGGVCTPIGVEVLEIAS